MAFGDNSLTGSFLEAKLASDPSLTASQKAHLRSYVLSLDPMHQTQLMNSLKFVAGGGIGTAIAKFLLGMGMRSSIIVGLVSGVLASSLGRPKPPEYDGFTFNRFTNIFGQSY